MSHQESCWQPLLTRAPHLLPLHPGETSQGAPLDTVHADTNILRGEGGAHSTAPVFGVCQ